MLFEVDGGNTNVISSLRAARQYNAFNHIFLMVPYHIQIVVKGLWQRA
jgi:hypothetical protein